MVKRFITTGDDGQLQRMENYNFLKLAKSWREVMQPVPMRNAYSLEIKRPFQVSGFISNTRSLAKKKFITLLLYKRKQ